MKLVVKIIVVDNGRFRACCTSLPGCVVHAESEDDAMRKMEAAIRSYLLSMNVAPPARLAMSLQMAPVGAS